MSIKKRALSIWRAFLDKEEKNRRDTNKDIIEKMLEELKDTMLKVATAQEQYEEDPVASMQTVAQCVQQARVNTRLIQLIQLNVVPVQEKLSADIRHFVESNILKKKGLLEVPDDYLET